MWHVYVDNCKLVDSLNEDTYNVLVDCHSRVLMDIDVDNLYGEINASEEWKYKI